MLLVLLGLLLVAIALAFAWQEWQAAGEAATVYGVEDSIEYVMAHLRPETASRLKRSDVRRILEWEVRYLQDPAVRFGGEPIVAGGLPAAGYAQETLARLGHAYDGPEIIEVLDLRADYLRSIGAIGAPLSATEVAELDGMEAES